MTNQQAADRIREHNRIHQRKEPRAIFITEALDKAVKLLEQTPDMEPMTIDEAIAYGKPVFVETMPVDGFGLFEWNTPEMVVEGVKNIDSDVRAFFRYWPDKPTPEQSAAWPWEES